MDITLDITIQIDRAGMDALPVLRRLNEEIFSERRIINRFDRDDLVILVAHADAEPIGFKVGYAETRRTFYSAKGGVVEPWRRRGVAVLMLEEMIAIARQLGYRRFAFDTFPNMHPGMTIVGLREEFRVTDAGYNATYKDYRIRFEKDI